MATDNQQAAVVTNPLAQDIEAQIKTNLVVPSEVKFSFRTTQVATGKKTTDKDGKEVDETKDWKRPTVARKLPLLTKAGLMAALASDDKSTELVLDAVNGTIVDRMRGIINDLIEQDPSVDLTTHQFDDNMLTLVAIANLPKGERGAGIAKEVWNSFVKDYKETMQTSAAIELFADKKARAPEVLDKHGILIQGKFNQIKTRKDIASQMLGFLDVWAQVSPNAEEFLAPYELLRNKGSTILQGEEFNDL